MGGSGAALRGLGGDGGQTTPWTGSGGGEGSGGREREEQQGRGTVAGGGHGGTVSREAQSVWRKKKSSKLKQRGVKGLRKELWKSAFDVDVF